MKKLSLALLGLVFFLLSMKIALTEEVSIREDELLLNKLLSREYLDLPDLCFGKRLLRGEDFNQGAAKKGSFSVPFLTQQEVKRIDCEADVDLDLSQAKRYILSLEFDRPEAVCSPVLYMRSGKGWFYATGRRVKAKDKKFVHCIYDLSDAKREQKPSGLNKIDRIRITFWRDRNLDFKVKVLSFTENTTSIGILNKGSSTKVDSYARRFEELLNDAGISADRIMQHSIGADILKRYDVIIIPIGEGLSERTVELLCDFMDHGGFVMAFYTFNPKLMKKMGFSSGTYVQCHQVNLEAMKVVFTSELRRKFAPWMPNDMLQFSSNFVWALPLENPEDPFLKQRPNAPRIVAWWYDSQGTRTKYPAMLYSGRGIYFSHVLSSDDPENKQDFVFALLTQYDKRGLLRAFCRNWQWLLDLGLPQESILQSENLLRAQKILALLKKKGWSSHEIVVLIKKMEDSSQYPQNEKSFSGRLCSLFKNLSEIRSELVHEYLLKMETVQKENRFWWDHSSTGPYPGDWDQTMKELAENGYNGVLSNMAWGGLVHYESQILPKSSRCLEYGDQLKQMVTAGKKYGVQTHFWKVCFNCANAPKEFVDRMIKEERCQKDRYGKPSSQCWLCPSHPKNQELEVAVMLEVAKNYNIDGIHFDYIRYPNENHCFCDGCRTRFSVVYKEKTGKDLKIWPSSVLEDQDTKQLFIQWRCDQITNVVRRVHDEIIRLDRKVLISAAVFGGYPNSMKSVGQDWGSWCKNGYLDFVCPMNYTADPIELGVMLDRQRAEIGDSCPICPGIGVTVPARLSPDKVAAQIQIARQKKCCGVCLFDLTKSSIRSIVPAFKGTPLGEKSEPFLNP